MEKVSQCVFNSNSIENENEKKRRYSAVTSKHIRDKLIDGSYDFTFSVRLINISCNGAVSVNESALYQNDLEALERPTSLLGAGLINTEKLKSPFTDRDFSVHIICAEHFKDLDDFQNIYISGYLYPSEELSCDMEYYLSHEDEMKKDLKREVNAEELNGENLVKLEQELFYNQMLNLFGDDGVPDSFDTCDEAAVNVDGYKFEKALMLEDFRLLFSDENITTAFAQRGNYYILLEGDV